MIKGGNKETENNKSPGPDGLPIEFFKIMNDERLKIVLDIVNDSWKNETMPDEMELAELVTLYKNGNVEDPANSNQTYKRPRRHIMGNAIRISKKEENIPTIICNP